LTLLLLSVSCFLLQSDEETSSVPLHQEQERFLVVGFGDDIRDVFNRVRRLAIHLEDDVTRMDACQIRRAPRLDAGDYYAVISIQAKLLRHLRGHILEQKSPLSLCGFAGLLTIGRLGGELSDGDGKLV